MPSLTETRACPTGPFHTPTQTSPECGGPHGQSQPRWRWEGKTLTGGEGTNEMSPGTRHGTPEKGHTGAQRTALLEGGSGPLRVAQARGARALGAVTDPLLGRAHRRQPRPEPGSGGRQDAHQQRKPEPRCLPVSRRLRFSSGEYILKPQQKGLFRAGGNTGLGEPRNTLCPLGGTQAPTQPLAPAERLPNPLPNSPGAPATRRTSRLSRGDWRLLAAAPTAPGELPRAWPGPGGHQEPEGRSPAQHPELTSPAHSPSLGLSKHGGGAGTAGVS